MPNLTKLRKEFEKDFNFSYIKATHKRYGIRWDKITDWWLKRFEHSLQEVWADGFQEGLTSMPLTTKKEIQEAVKEGELKALKSALRADHRYPVFANLEIGSISYRDWLKKQIKELKPKGK